MGQRRIEPHALWRHNEGTKGYLGLCTYCTCKPIADIVTATVVLGDDTTRWVAVCSKHFPKK